MSLLIKVPGTLTLCCCMFISTSKISSINIPIELNVLIVLIILIVLIVFMLLTVTTSFGLAILNVFKKGASSCGALLVKL